MPGVAHAIDEDRWPIVVARAPEGRPSDEELRQFILAVSSRCARGTPVALVVDCRRTVIRPKQRAILRASAARDARVLEGLVRGAVLVVGSRLERTLLRLRLWLAPPPFPIHASVDLEEALDWAHTQLDLLIPPRSENTTTPGGLPFSLL